MLQTELEALSNNLWKYLSSNKSKKKTKTENNPRGWQKKPADNLNVLLKKLHQ
jgi:hypothetical protein